MRAKKQANLKKCHRTALVEYFNSHKLFFLTEFNNPVQTRFNPRFKPDSSALIEVVVGHPNSIPTVPG